MATATEKLLSVENLSVHFHGEEEIARAVDGVSFEVRRRENVCLVGESGCGKTVSALAVMGLVPRPPGRVEGDRILFGGRDLLLLDDAAMEAVRGRKIGMVFQEPLTSLNPVLTIGEQIAEPLQIHTSLGPEEIHAATVRLLQDVGIDRPAERLRDYPHQLSGGQRQRVMIAMALACGPELLIADEPTTALDVTIQAQILKLLTRLQTALDMAVLYITHDLGVVSQIADRVYVMYAGLIVEHGPAAAILREPRHPYTRALLASLPHRRKRGRRLYSIPGSVPHPAHKPPGCPFNPRCEKALALCRTEPPALCLFTDGHAARCPVAAGLWR
ncbi:MAG: ABC transporter ATP-binding protein [Desulfobacterales bacterium]|nr:ABC transporter ATP-binding protein [Desulfobacterales bacterium]